MSTTGGSGSQGAGALGDALRRSLDDTPVDVASLLVGARQGARRIRRRRAGGAAIAVSVALVAGVPVAVGLIGTEAPSPVPAATQPTPSGPPTAVLVPPETSSGPPSFATLESGAVDVPLDAMLSPADVGALAPADDSGSRVGVLTVGTVVCGGEQEPASDLDVGGRSLLYAEDGANVLSVVRVLEPTGAAQVQTYLADALGRCDGASNDWQLQATDGLPGEQPVLALTEDYLEEGVQSVVGSVREGGVVTSVSVERRGTPDEVVDEVRRLLTRAHEKLVASGLPAAYPG